MRRAQQEDIPLLIELRASFYAESGYNLDHPAARDASARLLPKEHLGCVWLIDEEDLTVYRRLGLTEAPCRQLLLLPLAKPAHFEQKQAQRDFPKQA